MFENFSFDSAPVSAAGFLSPSIAPESAMSPFFRAMTPPLSPLEEEHVYLPKPTLASSLSNLSLSDKLVAAIPYTNDQLPSPTSPATAYFPPSPAPSSPANPRTCIRFQRQILARLQTSDVQLRCLSSLVEEMISSRDSCSVSAAPPLNNRYRLSSPPPSECRRGRRNSLPSLATVASGIKKSSSATKSRDLKLRRVSASSSPASFARGMAVKKTGKAASKKMAHQQRGRRGAVAAAAWRQESSGHQSD
jgi:hypothetical protein